MNTKNIAIVLSLFAMLALAIACSKKLPEREFGPAIDLPREMKNAEREPAVLEQSAVVVSVPVAQEFYVGPERFQVDELGYQISRILKGQPEANRIVYVAGARLVDFVDIVKILDSARKEGVNRIGLLVACGSDSAMIFRVQIPDEPKVDELVFKPNPLTLVVTISSKLKLQLNAEPMGEATDTTNLAQTLSQVFQQRKEQRAYKAGMETRTDLPEEERLERTIIVKATRSTPYGHVVRVIDALKGTGATPIVLQLDDLALE